MTEPLPPCEIHGKAPVVRYPCCDGAKGGRRLSPWKAASARENLAKARAAKVTPKYVDMATPGAVCTHCETALRGRVAWLELDQRTGEYHDRGDVDPATSQGWFPFGVACARAILRSGTLQARRAELVRLLARRALHGK